MGVAQEFSRLPSSVAPKNYNLWLKPCLENFTFRGKVDITVDVKEAVNRIELNSVEIEILSATFCHKDFRICDAASVEYDETHERVIVNFNEFLSVGEGVLSIIFNGTLNDKMKGLYRNRYVVDGKTKFGVATQFEATDARRCLPCWDEPALKATFDVTLVVLKDMIALSNANVVFEGEYFEDSKFKLVKYSTTPLMSTYLLGIVIGEFDFVSACTNKGLPIRVYTPKGKSSQGKFALDVAVKAIEYYEEYFKIPYPLPKLDLIALANFSIGAMENWGIVTFRETTLLIDEDCSSFESQRYVSLVVCHELAHMWFGNLVTMEWWTHLWLKEGFANFMEHMATDQCHPELDVWTYFVCSDHKQAKDLDALENSHPIEVPVQNPNEIDEIFDAISYSKGATIIRMLHDWVGAKNFRRGTQEYLNRHTYGNASTEDLWKALGDATGMPVREVMRTWTEQMGYPVIKVFVSSKNEEGVTIQLLQQKFSASQANEHRWSIPITILAGNGSIKKLLMKDPQEEIVLDGVRDNDWIKLNHEYFGFYRVHYDKPLLDALRGAMKSGTFSSHDRLSFQNDLFALASSGLSQTIDFLSCLECYQSETNYAVWKDLDCNISSLSYLFWDKEDLFTKFKSFVLTVYKDIAQKIGWDAKSNESHSDSMLRGVIIHRLGRFGSSSVISEARKRLDDHVSSVQVLPGNLRNAVYATILTHPRDGDLDKILRLHADAVIHEERVRIERCLGCVTDPSQMEKVLSFAMSDNVRSNDKVSLIGSLARGSSVGQQTAWSFVKSNWDELSEMYNGSRFIARLMKFTTENFSTEEKVAEVESFFYKHPVASADRTLHQSIENIRKNIDWWKRDGESIQEWIMKS